MLGWTGTDPNHSLNLRLFTVPGLQRVNKTIAPASFNSVAGPNFAENEHVDGMTWAARTPLQRVAYTFLHWTGTNWTGLDKPAFVQELSASNPGFVAARQVFPVTLAWTGTDAAHHLNLILNVTSSPEKFTLADTALGGPALGTVAQANEWLAWTGTDAAHHLNVATIQM